MTRRPLAVRLGASRRRALAALAAAGGVLALRVGRAASRRTPSMTEGPFYPQTFGDVPTPRLLSDGGEGRPMTLEGRVLDAAGNAVPDARVEIWQCDARGHYHHPRDGQPDRRDPRFAGFGWTRTDARGAYAFETIRPVPYPGRTPHVHVAVLAPNRPRLVTQIFIAGDPGNARDALYRMLPQAARDLVTIELQPAGGGFAGRFDVHLAA